MFFFLEKAEVIAEALHKAAHSCRFEHLVERACGFWANPAVVLQGLEGAFAKGFGADIVDGVLNDQTPGGRAFIGRLVGTVILEQAGETVMGDLAERTAGRPAFIIKQVLEAAKGERVFNPWGTQFGDVISE